MNFARNISAGSVVAEVRWQGLIEKGIGLPKTSANVLLNITPQGSA